jgi:hypothetical protein
VVVVPRDPLMPDDQAALGETEDVLVVADLPIDTLGVDRPKAEQHRVRVLPRTGADRQKTLDRRAARVSPVRAPAALRDGGRDGDERPEKHHGQCHRRSSEACYRLHENHPKSSLAPHRVALMSPPSEDARPNAPRSTASAKG